MFADIEERRWRWYFDGLSTSTREFIYNLPEQQWHEWQQSRATVLNLKCHIPGIADTFTPPLEWWEREVLAAMIIMSSDVMLALDNGLVGEAGEGTPIN